MAEPFANLREMLLAQTGHKQREARRVVAEHHALAPVQREQMPMPATEWTVFRQRRGKYFAQPACEFLGAVEDHAVDRVHCVATQRRVAPTNRLDKI